MKKLRLLLLIACALSVWQMKGQTGLDCSNAIPITQPFSQTYSSGVSERWYRFNATSTSALYEVSQKSNQINVSKIEFYSGTCSTLNLLIQDSLTSPTDSIKSLTAYNLTINTNYYIRVVFIDKTQKYDYLLNLAVPEALFCLQNLTTGVTCCFDEDGPNPGDCTSLNACVGDIISIFDQDPSSPYPITITDVSNPLSVISATIPVNGNYLYTCTTAGSFIIKDMAPITNSTQMLNVFGSVTPIVSPANGSVFCQDECVPILILNPVGSYTNAVIIPPFSAVPCFPSTTSFLFPLGLNTFEVDLNSGLTCSTSIVVDINIVPKTFTITSTPVPCSLIRDFNITTSCASIFNAYDWYTLSSTGVVDGTYTSPTPNFPITFASTGTYTVYVTDNSTSTTNSVVVNITAPSTPTITLIPAFISPLCIGACRTYTANGAVTYTWSTGVTTTTATFCPTVTTTYTVQGTSACGVVGTKTFVVTVYLPQGPITALANPNPICLGASTSLQASGANSYTWTGGSLGTVQANNIPVTPTVTTTYTVIGNNAICANNTQSAVVTVTVNGGSLPTFSIVTPALNVCANGTGTNTVLFGTSLASTAGLTFTWSPTAVHTPTANIDISQSTIVTVTVANSCSVTQVQSVNINYVASTCCTNTTVALSSFTVNSTTINNQTFKVAANQTITLNGTVIYNNCNFLMGTNSAIIALPTVVLNLNNCKLYSCEGMWQGIVLQHNSNQSAKIYVRNSNIEDAFNGINSDYPVNIFQQTSLINVSTTSVFNKNYKDIVITYATTNLSANTGIYPLTFMDSKMISQASTTSPGTNLKISNYYTPFIVNHSNTGLYTDNAGIITFTYTGGSNNLVKNKDYGLYLRKTSATVWNVDFKDMTGYLPSIVTCIGCPPPAPVVPLGIAIASGNAKFLYVKPPTGSVVNTTFSNIGYGIVTNKTANVDIRHCDFNNPAQYSSLLGYSYGSMGVWNLDAFDYLRVDSNAFNKTYTHVTVNYSVIPTPSTYTMSVSNNVMTAGSGVLTTGVMVQGATPFYNVLGTMAVAHNTLTNANTGIRVMSIASGLRVSNNKITLQNSATQLRTGVFLSGNNNGLMVDNNSINGNLTPIANATAYNLNCFGIRSDLSPNCFVQCNNITRVGNGITYNGNNAGSGSNANFFKNTLTYPIRRGLVLMNGGVIGQQGSASGASANVWNGFANPAGVDQTMVGVTGVLSDASNSKLWVHNITSGLTERPTDNGVSLPSAPGNQYSNLSVFTTTLGDIAGCPSPLTAGFRVALTTNNNVAQRNVDYTNYITTVVTPTATSIIPQAKWLLKQHMHKTIRQSTIGANTTVASFYAIEQANNVATYFAVDSLLSEGNMSLANAVNSGAGVSNNLEQNHKDYNTVYLNGAVSASDYATLQTLANLCAYENGNAVYQARALLNMLSYTNIDYNDSCGSEKASARLANISETKGVSIENITAKLYPNPNNGEFTLAYDLKQTPEATINISDVTGNIVYTAQITNETNLININTNDLKSGMYFIQLNSKGSLLWTNKVMISK